MVGGGQQFISHLIAVHNFVEQTGPVSKADFASQAGLGTVSSPLFDILIHGLFSYQILLIYYLAPLVHNY